MKRNHLKVFSLLLIVLFIISSFAGCTPSEGTQSPTDDPTTAPIDDPTVDDPEDLQTEPPEDVPGWQIDTSPITFDGYFNLSWFTEQWTTDEPTRTTTYVTDKTGVSFNWLAPTGNESEKMITMIVSGDLPDLIFSDLWDINNTKMIEAGHFLALNELADQYDTAFYDVVKPSQIGWLTREDGNVYDYPNFANAYENVIDLEDKSQVGGDAALAVRKDIYEAIGSPDMTTPEGFLDALKKAKEQFPEVNGFPISPLHMEFGEDGARLVNNYFPQFLAIPGMKDGKLYDQYTDDNFITWLKVLREANELGLISRDVFVEQRAQTEEKILNGRYFVVSRCKSDFQSANESLYDENKDNGMYYIPLDAVRNSNGDDPHINGKIMLDGWMNIHITSKCKDPARAIRFLNYAMGPEGQHDLYFGEEGVIYDMVDGKEVIKPELLDGTISDEDIASKYYGWGNNWAFYNSDIILAFPQQEAPYNPTRDFEEYSGKYFYPVPEFSNTTLDPSSDEGISSANISILWGETLPQLILAETEEEFDSLYDNFLSERESMGYADVQAAVEEKVIANKVSLGLD